MTPVWIAFACGLVLGGSAGVPVAAMLVAASRADDAPKPIRLRTIVLEPYGKDDSRSADHPERAN